ncbi:hypothetical protein ZWY2020_048647 [Hordeum vulgare]|nr:hypothetical protein ZWY2020_048647 [Hordeum vulgare]
MNLSVLITLTHLQRFWKKLFKAHQNPQEFKIIKKVLNRRKWRKREKKEERSWRTQLLDIPEDIYLDDCTPDEHETMAKRKIRLQKIERRWAKEWKEYRFVTPKYAKKFALKPPGRRTQLEDHQVAHPSSLMTIDDYPDEKEKHLAKLKKQAEAAVRKFNESSAAASGAANSSATETSGSEIPHTQSVPTKQRAPKPQEKSVQASVTKPSAPKPSVPKPSTPKPSAPKPSAPISYASKSSAPPPKPQEKTVQKHVVKPTTSSSSLPAATSSETKSSTPLVKTLATTERAPLPSPSKIIAVPSASEGSDDYGDETLQAIIRNKQERVVQASGSAIPLAMHPKVLLDYINIWYEDPNTPIDDLKLPPGISHMVATFINEAKWKEQQARQAKVGKGKKEKFHGQNLLKLTAHALVSTQAERQVLTDKYDRLSDCKSIKRNFIKLATSAVDDYNKKTAPPAPTRQPLVEQPADASPDEEETPQAEEEHQERRVDEPAIEEIITETATDEIATTDETAPDPAASSKQADDSVPAGSSLPSEESTERTPSPKASKVKKIIPSASDAKKTRAAEKEAKKRKASSAVEETKAERLKETEETAPLDPVPLNVAPSYEMVVIDDPATREDEEMKDVASEGHTDEEIQIDDSSQLLVPQTETAQTSVAEADETASATKPAEEKQAEENAHSEQTPHSEQADPTPQVEKEAEIPQPEAQLEQASSPQQEVPADEIPQLEENAEENVPAQDNEFIVLNPETAMVVSSPIPQQNLKPVQRQPFSKRPKFQKEDFFEERMYFIGENPYDNLQMRHLKFWTRTQMNYYSSMLCGRNKIFQHRHIPHVELEAIPSLEPVLSVLHDADGAVKLYGEHELPNGMMEVLMKPLAAGKPSRTTFLVHELKFNKKTCEPVEGKGKSMIEEGSRPLDGQFREPEAYSSWDDTETRLASPVPPRVLTTRELLLSLHQKDFDWSWPPKRKFRPIPVPDLEDSSFSSFRTAESDEEQLDTATGPRKKTTPKKRHDSSSTAKK